MHLWGVYLPGYQGGHNSHSSCHYCVDLSTPCPAIAVTLPQHAPIKHVGKQIHVRPVMCGLFLMVGLATLIHGHNLHVHGYGTSLSMFLCGPNPWRHGFNIHGLALPVPMGIDI